MVKRFLKRMYRGYYFDRFPYPTESDGRNPALYVLDEKGIDLLKRLGFDEVTGIPSKQISAFTTIPHTLAIADVRIAVAQAVEELGWEITQWLPETHFNQDYDLVTLPRERRPRSLKPDGFFVVKLPNERVSAFFLEVDRATENTRTFETKVRLYVEYLKNGQFKKRYGYKGFRVLTVIASEGRIRLHNLPRRMSSVSGIQRRFWFTHLEDVVEHNPLIEPIWEIAGDMPQARLFDPDQTAN